MKIEHFAINVAEPLKMASWYVEHLGLTIVRQQTETPFTHFLADESGTVMLEIYNNPAAHVPDYASMNPLLLHLAFVSENPELDKQRLLEAGATFEEEVRPPNGDVLFMLRDPWGISIQLCKRANSMLI